MYHHHKRLENQQVRVEILESGGKVSERKNIFYFWLVNDCCGVLLLWKHAMELK